jgi:hypothetical protein
MEVRGKRIDGALLERTMSEALANQHHQVPAELLQPLPLNLRERLLLLVPGGPRSSAELQSSEMMSPIALQGSGSTQLSMSINSKTGSPTRPVAC